jgi:hypothetical protein
MMLNVATKFVPDVSFFDQAFHAGFHCGEFWLNEEWLLKVETIIERAKYYPMKYVAHFPNKAVSSKGIECAVKLYRELGCRAMVIHEPMFRRHGEEILKLEPGLRLGVENHRLSPKEFEQWAEHYPGLTWDVEHFWKFTHEDCSLKDLLKYARTFLEKHVDKLRHVHLPGYVRGEEEHRPMYCNRDFVLAMFELFEEFRYDGLIVSEVDNEYQNPHDLRMDVLLFERWRLGKTVRM